MQCVFASVMGEEKADALKLTQNAAYHVPYIEFAFTAC